MNVVMEKRFNVGLGHFEMDGEVQLFSMGHRSVNPPMTCEHFKLSDPRQRARVF